MATMSVMKPLWLALCLLFNLVLAKPYSQASKEQYDVLRYLSAHGPYVEASGFGIDPAVPFGLEVTQAHILMRHGERYPTVGAGEELYDLYEKLNNTKVHSHKGPLKFIKNWKYIFPNSSLETESSKGVYAGLKRCRLEGEYFKENYGHLWNGSSVLPVFAASQPRVVASAEAFARGFFGEDLNLTEIVVLPEVEEQGANTLTANIGCSIFDDLANEDYVAEFNTTYLDREAERLNAKSPGYNLTAENVNTLVKFCAYDLNVQGHSEICKVLSPDVFVGFAYQRDLDLYYNKGPGYNLTNALGSLFVNATLALLNEEQDENLFMSFTHDTDITVIGSAFGMYDDTEDLPIDRIDFKRGFRMNDLVPMAGHIIIEKLSDGEDEYVRLLNNKAVFPLPWCHTGPGYSCPLEDFTDYLTEKIAKNDFVDICDLPEEDPQQITFFWDWDIEEYETIELEPESSTTNSSSKA
ncbi:unnamed protein product [Kuraishia capsulata CBS 1993]|uniref:Uncharacterized protein n=1 Tax=Kuraishia capsulata CBS 1993 TaxID=1382522 RepID=W6MI81_9ASCO|nr:uncharacterized protein KUCA_T00001563001 [Kuraishia capsulata CBS 1993]CDK25593.1 unnamed protein product [Kuraishia capsulata CBS 1993]